MPGAWYFIDLLATRTSPGGNAQSPFNGIKVSEYACELGITRKNKHVLLSDSLPHGWNSHYAHHVRYLVENIDYRSPRSGSKCSTAEKHLYCITFLGTKSLLAAPTMTCHELTDWGNGMIP